jgi:glutaredoxin
LSLEFRKIQGFEPMPDLPVVVYTRQGCHLCDDAYALLVQHGYRPEKVDVDTRSELADEFGNCVPVVVIDGKIRFRGRVNPVLLKRLKDSEN